MKSSFLRPFDHHHTRGLYLITEHAVRSDDVFEDVFPDVRVDCRQRVIQQVDVATAVDGSSQGHALLLAARQVNTLRWRAETTISSATYTRWLIEGIQY